MGALMRPGKLVDLTPNLFVGEHALAGTHGHPAKPLPAAEPL